MPASSSTTDTGARLAVLISGTGSNMVAIARACAEGRIPARVVAVISDVAEAAGLDRARELGLPAMAVDHRSFQRDGRTSRVAFEAALAAAISDSGADFIIL